MSETAIRAVVSADGSRLLFAHGDRQRLAALSGQPVEIQRKRQERTNAQNRRHWALMTVGAESLWQDRGEKHTLHDELAHLYFGLPPCEKTGLRRRRRTPKTNTKEFAEFTDWCAMKLVELGADLSAWDEETRKVEKAAA